MQVVFGEQQAEWVVFVGLQNRQTGAGCRSQQHPYVTQVVGLEVVVGVACVGFRNRALGVVHLREGLGATGRFDVNELATVVGGHAAARVARPHRQLLSRTAM